MSSGIVLLIVVVVMLVIIAYLVGILIRKRNDSRIAQSVNGIRNGLISRQIHSQILKIIFSKLKI